MADTLLFGLIWPPQKSSEEVEVPTAPILHRPDWARGLLGNEWGEKPTLSGRDRWQFGDSRKFVISASKRDAARGKSR